MKTGNKNFKGSPADTSWSPRVQWQVGLPLTLGAIQFLNSLENKQKASYSNSLPH